MRRRRVRVLVLAFWTLGLLTNDVAFAVSLPVFTTFDDDTVGEPPILNGDHQPSFLLIPETGSILVRVSACGIGTKPVEIFANSAGDYGGIHYTFFPVIDETLRVETTVAFDGPVAGYFCRLLPGQRL